MRSVTKFTRRFVRTFWMESMAPSQGGCAATSRWRSAGRWPRLSTRSCLTPPVRGCHLRRVLLTTASLSLGPLSATTAPWTLVLMPQRRSVIFSLRRCASRCTDWCPSSSLRRSVKRCQERCATPLSRTQGRSRLLYSQNGVSSQSQSRSLSMSMNLNPTNHSHHLLLNTPCPHHLCITLLLTLLSTTLTHHLYIIQLTMALSIPPFHHLTNMVSRSFQDPHTTQCL